MRVLMLSWEYAPHVVGGLGKHVMELAPALVAAGVEVHIITPLLRGGEPFEVSPAGVHVHRVEPPQMQNYGFVSFAHETNAVMERAGRALAVEVGGFDLLHAHDWLSAGAGVALKYAWRAPLVTTMHATERGRGRGAINGSQAERINSIEWWLTYESWRVITCSHFMARQMQEYFNTPADKLDVVPNGIQARPSPFRSEKTRSAFRRRFAEDDQPIAFYVGRVVFEKGVHVLLAAWPRVLASHPGAKLLIAGAGTYLDTIKDQARSLGLGGSVIFVGFIPDRERDRLYHIADVAVFPSLYEPFGIVALEAMAARCPVVVAETGGLVEVVKLHETGLLVHPDNPESLAWGIVHTLQRPDWAQVRVENAYREVRDLFNWRRIATTTRQVYERVLREWEQDTWGKELVPRAT